MILLRAFRDKDKSQRSCVIRVFSIETKSAAFTKEGAANPLSLSRARAVCLSQHEAFRLSRSWARRTAASVLRSFVNSWLNWLRNSQRRGGAANTMQLRPIVCAYACARACKLHNRNALPILPPPFCLSLSLSLCPFLSHSPSKRASLIMRKTDSTSDQRISPVRSPLS